MARAEFDALTYGGNPDKAAGAKMGFAQIDDEASLAAIKVGTPATEVGSAIVKLSGISEMLQTVADQVATGFNEEPFGGAVMQTQDYIDAWKTSI